MLPTQIILYSTSGCHLCDEALDVLAPVCREFGLEIIQIDICSSEHLEQLYETRIPVISLQQAELGWPFTSAEVGDFLLRNLQKN